MNMMMIIAIILAYVVKGMCGFANTLVFSTIMSFTADNVQITPIDLLLGYPANAVMAWKERSGISPKVCVPLSVLVIVGSIPGAIYLKNGSPQNIKVLLGFVVVFLGVEMLLREYGKKRKESSPIVLGVIGLISGILCGLFGIGAFLTAYISRTTENSSQFKGNISVVFLVENTFRIILYSATGILHMGIVKTAVCLLPVMAAGLFLGMYLGDKVNEQTTKKVVAVLLALSGISLVLNNL